MKNASLTYKSSSLANGWPMIWHRGRCPTNWYQERRSYVWYLKGYKWCHSNNQVMSIKNARFKPQPSTPNANLCINKKHTFYGNWWQRGRDCTKIWKLWERLRQRSRGWTWTWTKREQHWRKEMDQSSWTRKSTQVGGASSWTLIGCIWYVHIHALAYNA